MRRKMKPDSKIDDKTYDLEQNKYCAVEKSFRRTFWVTFNAILQKRLYSASKKLPRVLDRRDAECVIYNVSNQCENCFSQDCWSFFLLLDSS